MSGPVDFSCSTPETVAFAPSEVVCGRDLPPGSIRWHVDCAKNSLDQRPAAEGILSAIDERRAELDPGQSLVVLMGERHSCPTHYALQRLVMGALHARGERLTIADELPYNHWMRIAANRMERGGREALCHTLGYRADPTGLATLSVCLGYDIQPFAPFSNWSKEAELYKWIAADVRQGKDPQIGFLFSDAARDVSDGYHLSLQDPLTGAAMESVFRRHPEWGAVKSKNTINPCSVGGTAIRNEVMAAAALDYAKKRGDLLILQMTGIAHLLGDIKDGAAFADSLSAAFARAGAAVLVVFPTTQNHGVNTFPEEAGATLGQAGFVVDGLSEESYKMWILPSGEGILDGDEINFIQKINAATGDKIPYIEVNKNRADWQQVAGQHVDNILAAHQKEAYVPAPLSENVPCPAF